LPRPQKAALKLLPAADEQVIDPDSEMAHTLQPLLEQEALLESFIEEATARRKFEDAKTLKANLVEIRAEIDKIINNAHDGTAPLPGKATGAGTRR
jgi:rabenosyn-5